MNRRKAASSTWLPSSFPSRRDRWIAFDGVEELPVSKSLMLEHWLQQMAEVRYNILAKAPVPVEWMPEEGRIEVANAGRTWLIVHRSGCPQFDEARLERLKASLAGSLGEPRFRVERLTRGETIESYEYPASVLQPSGRSRCSEVEEGEWGQEMAPDRVTLTDPAHSAHPSFIGEIERRSTSTRRSATIAGRTRRWRGRRGPSWASG